MVFDNLNLFVIFSKLRYGIINIEYFRKDFAPEEQLSVIGANPRFV